MNADKSPLTKKILTPEQVKDGFSVEEDDHCLYLLLDGVRVAVFSTSGATAAAVREAADTIDTGRINRERR